MKPLEQQSNDRPRFGPRAAATGLLLALAVLLVAVGCSPLRLLQPNQRLLTKVVVESDGLLPAQQERLLTLVQQKPNRTIPIPKLAVYQLGHSFYDSARIERKIQRLRQKYADKLADNQDDSARRGKLLARRDKLLARKRTALEKGNSIMRLGEPPVIYDPSLSQRTVEQLATYLRSQGYFRATATFTDSARSKPTLIARTLRGLGLRKPVRAVPLRDSAGGRLHRLVTVTYQVKEGKGFTLSQFTRSIPDTGVARVVAGAQGATLLHVGEAYNEDLIGQERQRIETLLKNAGYYDFRSQYISLEADTSFEKNQVRLRLLIASPPGGHRAYQLRRVTVITDVTQARALRLAAGDTTRRAGRRLGPVVADTTTLSGRAPGSSSGRISTANMPAGVSPAVVADSLSARRLRRAGRQAIPRDTVRLDSLVFLSRGPLPINPRILARQVVVRPGQLYNQARTQRTQRQLANLDMFRFNTVSYRKVAAASAADAEPADSSQTLTLTPGTASSARGPSYLDAIVTTSPSPRFSETTELGGTYVAGLVGPFANLRLKWRNPFGGAEVLELSGRAGVEGQLTQLGDSGNTTAATYTTQYGATLALLLPQFVTPFHLGNFLQNYQPRTRLALSTTYTSSNYYTRRNAELTLDYLWQTSAYQQYIFTPVDLGLVDSKVGTFYQRRLDDLRINQGSPLYRSFQPIYEPSFSFTSIFNSNDLNQTRNAHFLRVFVELGGLTRGLYRNEKWFEDTGLSVYNFAKLTVDYRRYYKLSPLTYLAWRLNGGVAHALTESPDPNPLPGQPAQLRYILPYDKYLFAGGSNSVRAWSPRRLGTGTYATLLPSVNGNPQQRDYYTEQPGELLLEGSLEYRFPVYSFIKGALFTDFGNVWALQNDANRPGADFRLASFYKQFAVGSGFGIRMDFTFLILRFDIATKVYDPTETGQPWRLQNAIRHVDNQTVVNVGLGYPF
ncbi:MAG: BamA/TamA family outer membrane protein [Janthinobacterium lividum]